MPMIFQCKICFIVIATFYKIYFFKSTVFTLYNSVFDLKKKYVKYGRVLHSYPVSQITRIKYQKVILYYFPLIHKLIFVNSVYRSQCVYGFLGGVCQLKQL